MARQLCDPRASKEYVPVRLPCEVIETLDRITSREHRSSRSDTIRALLSEALAARHRRAKRAK